MKPYRKEDQYYYDIYDRFTLKDVREFHRKVLPGMSEPELNALEIRYQDFVKKRYKNREDAVKLWMKEDEVKDQTVLKFKTPKGIKCEECGKNLILCSHLFGSFDEDFLFVFECVNPDHSPRTLVLPDGEIKYISRPGCKACGNTIKTIKENNGNLLILTDECVSCGKKEVHEFDLTPEASINEADRKIYCLTDYGNTFMEDLKSIESFMDICEKLQKDIKEKKKYNIDKIQRKTIPQIKEILATELSVNGFTDLSFEKPNASRYLTVPFTIIDSTTRNEADSVRTLKKNLKTTLTYTNWRLSGELEYRLGFITGKLKGVECEDDLLELAKKLESKSDLEEID